MLNNEEINKILTKTEFIGDEKFIEPTFLIGTTGSGKSTLSYYLQKVKLENTSDDQFDMVIDVPKNLKDQYPEICHSGAISGTKEPISFLIEDKTWCDFPGFLDTGIKTQRIINVINASQYFKKLEDQELKLCYLINYNDFADRADTFKDGTLEVLSQMFKNFHINNQNNVLDPIASIIFVITHAPQHIQKKHILKRFSKFITQMAEDDLELYKNRINYLSRILNYGNIVIGNVLDDGETRDEIFRLKTQCSGISDHSQIDFIASSETLDLIENFARISALENNNNLIKTLSEIPKQRKFLENNIQNKKIKLQKIEERIHFITSNHLALQEIRENRLNNDINNLKANLDEEERRIKENLKLEQQFLELEKTRKVDNQIEENKLQVQLQKKHTIHKLNETHTLRVEELKRGYENKNKELYIQAKKYIQSIDNQIFERNNICKQKVISINNIKNDLIPLENKFSNNQPPTRTREVNIATWHPHQLTLSGAVSYTIAEDYISCLFQGHHGAKITNQSTNGSNLKANYNNFYTYWKTSKWWNAWQEVERRDQHKNGMITLKVVLLTKEYREYEKYQSLKNQSQGIPNEIKSIKLDISKLENSKRNLEIENQRKIECQKDINNYQLYIDIKILEKQRDEKIRQIESAQYKSSQEVINFQRTCLQEMNNRWEQIKKETIQKGKAEMLKINQQIEKIRRETKEYQEINEIDYHNKINALENDFKAYKQEVYSDYSNILKLYDEQNELDETIKNSEPASKLLIRLKNSINLDMNIVNNFLANRIEWQNKRSDMDIININEEIEDVKREMIHYQ